ncbi:hypothetical protein HDV02_004788 [Globomyces sp. JEL0801]|nr:hypothetical protein HDV02_004788 [Globomyces sp. JEL0801]
MKFDLGLVIVLATVAAQQPTCGKVTYRKEVSDMTAQEWKVFVDTIRTANNRGIWIAAANTHSSMNPQIHWNCNFYFWHRRFLLDIEKKLQAINPAFFFPWWDSPTTVNSVSRAALWNHIGTFGTPVRNNPFGASILRTDDNSNQPLIRDIPSLEYLNGQLPAQTLYDSYTQQSLRRGGFSYWSQRSEATHGVLHYTVGGDNGQMSYMHSPADPLFYIHHATLDYLWVKAQDTWNAARLGPAAQYGGLQSDGRSRCTFNSRIPGYNNILQDVLSTKSICVEYLRRGQRPPALMKREEYTTNSSTPISSATSTSTVNATTNIADYTTTKASTGVTTATSVSLTTSTISSVSSATTQSANTTLYATSVVPTTTGSPYLIPTNIEILIPTDVPRYQYPTDYVPMKSCPPPMPEKWLKMLAVNSNYDVVKQQVDEIYSDCNTLVTKLSNGYEVPPMVDWDCEKRPVISFTEDECIKYSGKDGVAVPYTPYGPYADGNSTVYTPEKSKPLDNNYQIASAAIYEKISLFGAAIAALLAL